MTIDGCFCYFGEKRTVPHCDDKPHYSVNADMAKQLFEIDMKSEESVSRIAYVLEKYFCQMLFLEKEAHFKSVEETASLGVWHSLTSKYGILELLTTMLDELESDKRCWGVEPLNFDSLLNGVVPYADAAAMNDWRHKVVHHMLESIAQIESVYGINLPYTAKINYITRNYAGYLNDVIAALFELSGTSYHFGFTIDKHTHAEFASYSNFLLDYKNSLIDDFSGTQFSQFCHDNRQSTSPSLPRFVMRVDSPTAVSCEQLRFHFFEESYRSRSAAYDLSTTLVLLQQFFLAIPIMIGLSLVSQYAIKPLMRRFYVQRGWHVVSDIGSNFRPFLEFIQAYQKEKRQLIDWGHVDSTLYALFLKMREYEKLENNNDETHETDFKTEIDSIRARVARGEVINQSDLNQLDNHEKRFRRAQGRKKKRKVKKIDKVADADKKDQAALPRHQEAPSVSSAHDSDHEKSTSRTAVADVLAQMAESILSTGEQQQRLVTSLNEQIRLTCSVHDLPESNLDALFSPLITMVNKMASSGKFTLAWEQLVTQIKADDHIIRSAESVENEKTEATARMAILQCITRFKRNHQISLTLDRVDRSVKQRRSPIKKQPRATATIAASKPSQKPDVRTSSPSATPMRSISLDDCITDAKALKETLGEMAEPEKYKKQLTLINDVVTVLEHHEHEFDWLQQQCSLLSGRIDREKESMDSQVVIDFLESCLAIRSIIKPISGWTFLQLQDQAKTSQLATDILRKIKAEKTMARQCSVELAGASVITRRPEAVMHLNQSRFYIQADTIVQNNKENKMDCVAELYLYAVSLRFSAAVKPNKDDMDIANTILHSWLASDDMTLAPQRMQKKTPAQHLTHVQQMLDVFSATADVEIAMIIRFLYICAISDRFVDAGLIFDNDDIRFVADDDAPGLQSESFALFTPIRSIRNRFSHPKISDTQSFSSYKERNSEFFRANQVNVSALVERVSQEAKTVRAQLDVIKQLV